MKYIVISIWLLLLIPATLRAQEDLGKMRGFFDLSGSYTYLGGSFNGQDYFETDLDILLVPRIKPGPGIGGCFGFRYFPPANNSGEFMGAFGMSFGYYIFRSTYTTRESEYIGNCTTHLIRYLSFTSYFKNRAQGLISPYLDIDLSVAFTHCDKIAYPRFSIEDPIKASYSGVIFGMGLGTLVNFSKRVVLDLKVLPEYYMGTDIRAKDRKRYEITKFGNFVLHTTFGLRIYIKPL